MTILRAGLYERVSTEEQALKGFSIDAQIDNLTEYCQKQKIKKQKGRGIILGLLCYVPFISACIRAFI